MSSSSTLFQRVFALSLTLLHVAFAVQLTSVITPEDGKRLISYFKAPYKDLETAAFSVYGLKDYSQGGAIGTAEKEAACKLASTCDTSSISSLFQAAQIKDALGSGCKHQFSKEAIDFAKSKINENSDIVTIYKATAFLKHAGKQVDNAAVAALLTNALKEDNTIWSSAFAVLAGTKLDTKSLADILKSADVEDMAAQADEVDGRYLHFDNDVSLTSTFLNIVFEVSKTLKQPPIISSEQITLFANFLLRSKTAVASTKDAFFVLHGLGAIVGSAQFSLAKAEITSGSSISQETPKIAVSISNLFSQPLTKLSVKAESVTRSSDDEVILSNSPLAFDGVKSYSMPLWNDKLKSGFYDVSLIVTSPGIKLAGVSDLQFKVKVTTKISLVNVELGTAERESVGAALKKLEFLKKAARLKADNLQKIVMKFQVQSLTDKALLSPHQAFVRFLHEKSGQEVIFVAEPEKDLSFKFEVDLGVGGREQFNSVSGKYSMHLIVGDVSISNPVFWNFGDVDLQLGEETQKPKASFEDQYAAKPEIHHIFRKPEKRPPMILSQAFTVACLIPLLVLFVLWTRIGANLGGFRLSLKNIIFHAGLAGIFVLYYMFWTTWNMFTTLQYLGVIGAVTFVFGNSVLSDIANNR